jgi:hypothetical protein
MQLPDRPDRVEPRAKNDDLNHFLY